MEWIKVALAYIGLTIFACMWTLGAAKPTALEERISKKLNFR